MKPHPRFNGSESVYDALTAVEELDSGIVKALGQPGYALLHSVAVHAPGTFFHSMRVLEMMRGAGYALLADEAAAVLLHDCGKLVGPGIFAENGGGERPKPWQLSGHVDHGLMIADDIPLSDLQRSAINEHHGTSIIQEEKLGKEGNVVRPEIRYQGSKPRTLFTAVLNMADTMEAITSGQGRRRANELLGGICEQRIQDGQFDLVGHDEIRAATQRLVESSEIDSSVSL